MYFEEPLVKVISFTTFDKSFRKIPKTGWAANRTSPECFCLITGRCLWRCPRSRRVDAITSLAPVNNSDLAGVDLTRSRRVRSGRVRADRDGRGKSSAAIPSARPGAARRMTNAKYANDLILTSSSAAGGVWMRPLKHRLLDVSKCPAVILDTTAVKQTTAQLLSRITYFLFPLNFATVCFVSKLESTRLLWNLSADCWDLSVPGTILCLP